jgi:hypothetical protein
VVRAQRDTVRFATPAVARPCRGGRSLLLEGASELGQGVLVLVRFGDSLDSGTIPLVLLGDTITPRGADVAVRYMMEDASHGFALDSGGVELRPTRDSVGARVHGTGLENGMPMALEAEYAAVPFAADTVPCGFLK